MKKVSCKKPKAAKSSWQLFLFLTLTGCYHSKDDVAPKLTIAVQEQYLKSLPPAGEPLSIEEIATDWGKEYKIALGFGHEFELYPASIGFKRALFLLPENLSLRKKELEYDLLFTYFLGRKYQDVLYTFHKSTFRFGAEETPTLGLDALIMVYDAYQEVGEKEKSDQIVQRIGAISPSIAKRLELSSLLVRGELSEAEDSFSQDPIVQKIATTYRAHTKSIQTAQILNACFPGAGYFYVGQTQSAVTALLLNSLFLWGSVHFFLHHHVAAGAIMASFEAGWYFGGIYGAGQEARFYNQRVYEEVATPLMQEARLLPVLMVSHGF